MSENDGKTTAFPHGGVKFTSDHQPENRGRPKGSVSIKAELQKLMDIMLIGEINPLNDLPEDMPVGRKVALNLVMKAVADGDLNAVKQIIENLEGKPAQSLNVGGQGEENPMHVSTKMVVELVRPKVSADA